MPILNYTTKISVSKTLGEIQTLLQRAGAQAILQEFDGGVTTAVSFRIVAPQGVLMFKLPCNVQGVHKALKQKAAPRYRTADQAARVAWRIVKDWIEAQIAMIEADQADTVELFLPFAQDSEGRTVYEKLQQTDFKLLTHEE